MHIQQLASELWTDYNTHDPGITLLEVLCYGLTDLGYRTNFDMKDLLTRSEMGVPLAPAYFHQAREIFTNGPVSFQDLRKILIDIEGVRHAWIEKHQSLQYCVNEEEQLAECTGAEGEIICDPLNGLYDVFIEYEEFVEELFVGLKDNVSGEGKYEHAELGKMRFVVHRDVVIEQVHVYADCPGDIIIRLLDADRNIYIDPITSLPAVHTDTIETPNVKTPIDLGFCVVPNEYEDKNFYFLEVESNDAKLFMSQEVEYCFELEEVIELQPEEDSIDFYNPYHFFYDWRIGFKEPNGTTYRKRATTGLLSTVGHEPRFIPVEDQAIVFDVEKELTLHSVEIIGDVADNMPGQVKVKILDFAGVLIAEETVVIDATNRKKPVKVPLNVTLQPCQNYRIQAESDYVQLYTAFKVKFPFSIDQVIILLGGTTNQTLFHTYYFFYTWEISYEQNVGENIPEFPNTKTYVCQQVLDKLLKCRNLGEDLMCIKELEPEEISICADIDLSAGADIEAILAEIFYVLEEHIKPSVKFYTLEELKEKGRPTDQIFEGPKLDHGFIDDDEFNQIQRYRHFRASDIIQLLMDIPGVEGIRNMRLLSFIDEILRCEEPWVLCPSLYPCRIPNFSPKRSNIIFYKNGLPFYANLDKTLSLLEDRVNREMNLKHKEHKDNLPVPLGDDMELQDYLPVQNDLPLNYMVGQFKVPESAGTLRKAQSRQLKGYLLFFEQLLANYLAQLAHVNELFSWKPLEEGEGVRTYFTQVIGKAEIADLENLYFDYPELAQSLNQIIEGAETAHERKLRFLDHLLARFAESFTDYSLLMYRSHRDKDSLDISRRLIEDKQYFLKDYPLISSERAKAFDYRYPKALDNLSGYQRRIYRLLGIRDTQRRDLAGHRLQLISDGGEWKFVLLDEPNDPLFTSVSCPSKAAVAAMLDSTLRLLCKPSEAYIVDPCEGDWDLYRICGENRREKIGYFRDEMAVEPGLAYFQQYANSEGFHLVEHILLRKRTEDDPFMPIQLRGDCECEKNDSWDSSPEAGCECVEVKDPYSFRVSIILPTWPKRFQDINFRKFVEDILRAEAPAHIYLKICWISHEEMREFEVCHMNWLCELACLDRNVKCVCPDPEEEMENMKVTSPYPETEPKNYEVYRTSLEEIIDKLHNLTHIHPSMPLHDCEQASGDSAQFMLNQSNLNTLGLEPDKK